MKYHEILGGFRGESNEPIAPTKTVEVRPGEFADEWSKRPRANIVAGLRLLPYEEDQIAVKQAAKAAVEVYPDANDADKREEEFLAAIRAWCVARSLCDPNDVKKHHPAIPMAEDTIRSALTGVAITRLFDEIERHHIDSSPLFPEATDEELIALVSLLSKPEPFAALSEAKAARCRRYAHFIMAELIDASPLDFDEPETEGVVPMPDE